MAPTAITPSAETQPSPFGALKGTARKHFQNNSHDHQQFEKSEVLGKVPLVDLYSGNSDSLSPNSSTINLKDEIIQGLQAIDKIVIPGSAKDPEDVKFVHRKSLPTMILYDEQGLILYDRLTTAPEYYLYKAELEILQEYGPEIAMRIFGHSLPESAELIIPNVAIDQRHQHDHFHHKRLSCDFSKDLSSKNGIQYNGNVDRHNCGIQADDSLGISQSVGPGSLIELGAGSLKKTVHLIRALSNLPRIGCGPSVNYFALDLDRRELARTLEDLHAREAMHSDKHRWTVLDGKVGINGMWATYDTGIEFISKGGIAQFLKDGGDSCVNVEGRRCLMWLGSAIGNFDRASAADFLSKITNTCLRPGDTMLISIDRRNKPSDIALAYNDPSGLTRDFIMNGLEHVNKLFGGNVIDTRKFEFVGRYNRREGRFESYYQSKIVQKLQLFGHSIEISKSELIHVENSYKYSEQEAVNLFDFAGLRIVQRWTNKTHQYDTWLVEKPQFYFPNLRLVPPLVDPDTEGSSDEPSCYAGGGCAHCRVKNYVQPSNLLGLPSLEDWKVAWQAWDNVTLTMIPPSMLHEKPIHLRHICLFYLGHIPAFADIHISNYLQEPYTNQYFCSIFERGIDPDIDDETKCNPHSEVPTKTEGWPVLQDIRDYQSTVKQRIERIYTNIASGSLQLNRRLARILWMMHEHIAMHLETLLYMLAQSKNTQAPAGFSAPDWFTLAKMWDAEFEHQCGRLASQQRIYFEAGTIIVGHDDDDSKDYDVIAPVPTNDISNLNYQLGSPEFGWDNEHPQRTLSTGSFSISALPVSNAEFAEYLEATGRTDLPASWVCSEDGKGYRVRTVYGAVDMQVAKHWPVQASGTQLAAFAEWKGGRLPTHAELRRFLDAPPEALILDLTTTPYSKEDEQRSKDLPGRERTPVQEAAVKYVPPSEQSEEDHNWMQEALTMAKEALRANEMPVGGVFVRNSEIVARGWNRINELRGAPHDAKLTVIDYILSILPLKNENYSVDPFSCPPAGDNLKGSTLYVTIEPHKICNHILRQFGIRRVLFGVSNERIGGIRSVVPCDDEESLNDSPSYESSGGYLREEVISLLKQYYLTRNSCASKIPNRPRKTLRTRNPASRISMRQARNQTKHLECQARESKGELLWNLPQPQAPLANVGFKNWHPVPASLPRYDSDGSPLPGHNGGVWEWTSTPFMGYDGFRASELYPGYSADFFDGKHSVVLGGSWATVPSIANRRSFVNYYQTGYPYMFGGARVVYDS